MTEQDIFAGLWEPKDKEADKNGYIQMWPFSLFSAHYAICPQIQESGTEHGRALIMFGGHLPSMSVECVIAIPKAFFEALVQSKIGDRPRACEAIAEWSSQYTTIPFLDESSMTFQRVEDDVVYFYRCIHTPHVVSYATSPAPVTISPYPDQNVPFHIHRTVNKEVALAILTDTLQAFATTGFYEVKHPHSEEYGPELRAPLVRPLQTLYSGQVFIQTTIKNDFSLVFLDGLLTTQEAPGFVGRPEIEDSRKQLFKCLKPLL